MSRAGATTGRGVTAAAVGLAGILLTAGTLHFTSPRPFDAIMPEAIPPQAHRPLTYASGAAEVAIGLGLLRRRTRRSAAWAAAALLLAVWPANIQAALDGGYRGLPAPFGGPAAAWLRVPLQLPLIGAAWWIARRTPEVEDPR